MVLGYDLHVNNHLGEIAHKVASSIIHFCQNIKKEGFHVIVQCLVIQKHFSQEA